MIETGSPAPLGSRPVGQGVNFAVWAPRAERVDLCLFDGGHERCVTLPVSSDGVWHGFVPGCGPGQKYGFRAHGPYSPSEGLRFNPAKLLMDPYARNLAGAFQWSPAVFDFVPDRPEAADGRDSAPFVPRSVVVGAAPDAIARGPRIPWNETIVYEASVRGFTMRHPELSESERGRFTGMRNGDILEYLKALGITTVELLPVFAWLDEQALIKRGLRNFWGYNTINFFTPDARLAGTNATDEFRDMVAAIHDAGIEIVLDVVYNHTAESDANGPSLCYRGLDNPGYYRLDESDRSRYLNFTGCGNMLDADSPCVQDLVVDSLCYWHTEMGVDGFRFDLATVLGRGAAGFDTGHPLLQRITREPSLRDVKLIAEPWDIGPDGYRLGQFPAGWSEWNDRFRNAARQFWLDSTRDGPGRLARRVHGSSDLFESGGRSPWSSINYVTCHDGFTLADLVSYERRHNLANGENNRDGERHNFSANHGVEGPAQDPAIRSLRRRQRLNLLATVLFSQGTPMLLAGDEFGNSQFGNNNAYAQDNEIGWLDWSGLETDAPFLDEVRTLVALRREQAALRMCGWVHAAAQPMGDEPGVSWLRPDGGDMLEHDWYHGTAICMLLSRPADRTSPASVAVVLFNAGPEPCRFHLPEVPRELAWRCRFTSGGGPEPGDGERTFMLREHSIACLTGDALNGDVA